MKVLLSSAAYELTDYYPASEGLAAYNIMNQLKDRVFFYAVAGNVKIKKPLGNAQIYEIKIVKDHFRLLNPAIGLISGLYYQLMAFSISSKILLEKEVNIVHRMFPAIYGLTFDPISLIAERMGIPFVIGPICRPVSSIALRWTRALHLSTVKAASAVIVQTKGLKEEYSKILDPKRIWVIPLGVDTDFFSPAQGNADKGWVEVLTVANLTERKGVDYLIRAVHSLRKHHKVKLRIVGEGPEKRRLVEITSMLGLDKDVVFEGRVPRSKLRDLYRGSDIFCLPSLVEPFGKVVIEAMACGKPVIVTDTEGPSQIVSHMRDGIIVPRGDHRKIAEAISLLLDHKLRISMGRSARKKAEEYSWKEVAGKLYEVYGAVWES